jgi:pimeloyl-ACP methyl ester carboxylesterase
VSVGGRQWAYREAGDGDTVMLLDPAPLGVADAGPLEQLTESYRLIATSLQTDTASGRDGARSVREFAAAIGCERCAVIARGAAAGVALWLAIDSPALVTAIVIESPPLLSDDAGFGNGPDSTLVDAMPALEVPTLVLLGQGAASGITERLTAYKRLPASTVGIVYGAGEDVRQRPSAYLTAVSEYLERGQAFVVSDKSTVIHA